MNTNRIYIYILLCISIYYDQVDTIYLVLNTGARASTPDIMDDPVDPAVDHALDPLELPQSPHTPEPQGRQKSAAAVQSFRPSAFLARISAPLTHETVDIIKDVRGHYAVPDGDQVPGVESDGYREGLKRKADAITRTQYEVYSFSTKHNLSEAAVDELLEMLSNVCTHLVHSFKFNAIIRAKVLYFLAMQIRFSPPDIQNKTMKSMDQAARLAMMPEYEMYCVDLTEGVASCCSSGKYKQMCTNTY
jgi:hypothetical protein